jgi:APA family basic amino acid/polyamine antiporter
MANTSVFRSLFRTKPLSHAEQQDSGLHRCLTAFDLTLLGIGAIIGAGVFVLTGIAAANNAGPGVIISFLLAGLASTFSALSYAELASSIGGCGSAYGYAFAGFGEFIAWIMGWNLLLEYGMACSTVAIGWSGYADNALASIGVHLPDALLKNPFQGGLINLPAALIILAITAMLTLGVRQSTRFNNIIVFVKLGAIAIFVAIAAFHVNPTNWHPFLPFGWQGVLHGAALIFFAYIGFDAVSTASEEAINPKRDLPIGIIASLIICTLAYMLVAGLLTGIAHYSTLAVSSPVSQALLSLGFHFAAGLVAVGAIAGLTTVILVMYYGFTRVFLAMTRDGLLPASFAKINPKTKTPVRIIVSVGVVMALVAGLIPMQNVAELVNIGTLAAFATVCLGVVILRVTKPDMHRPFKTPFSPLIPILGAVFAVVLMFSLPSITWWRFIIWTLIGIGIYFGFSRKHSILRK